MKKNLFIVTLVLTFTALFVLPVSAEPTDKQVKAAKSAAVKRAKQLTKDGWKMISSLPLETALQQHFLKLEGFGGTAREYAPVIEGKKTIDEATTQARNAASQYYTQDAKSFIEGKVKSLMEDNNDDGGVKNFIASFEQTMVTEIKSTLNASFTIFRPNPSDNTKKDVLIFYTYQLDSEKYEAEFDKGIKEISE